MDACLTTLQTAPRFNLSTAMPVSTWYMCLSESVWDPLAKVWSFQLSLTDHVLNGIFLDITSDLVSVSQIGSVSAGNNSRMTLFSTKLPLESRSKGVPHPTDRKCAHTATSNKSHTPSCLKKMTKTISHGTVDVQFWSLMDTNLHDVYSIFLSITHNLMVALPLHVLQKPAIPLIIQMMCVRAEKHLNHAWWSLRTIIWHH